MTSGTKRGTAFQSGDLLAGRRGLIMGVANDHSIAWGIAKAAAAHGAELAFTSILTMALMNLLFV